MDFVLTIPLLDGNEMKTETGDRAQELKESLEGGGKFLPPKYTRTTVNLVIASE